MTELIRSAARVNVEAVATDVVARAAPVAVFQGYDSVTGSGLSTALTGETKTVGGTSSVSYRICTDIETLSSALEIDQSLSVSFGPVGNVDQKTKFVHNLNITTFSVSIVVFARHLKGSEVMTHAALKQGMNPPHGTEELRNFFRGYGDSFISSVSEGGEYYAVYTYFSQTREEQFELTASMNAHGIFQGGSVDASLQTKISSFNSSVTTRIAFDQNMSGIRDPKFPDSDHIIEFALAFPSMELTAPAIVEFETLGYERVPNFGDFQPVAKNREFFVGNTVVGGLTKPLVTIQQLQNQIEWIKQVYQFYGGYSDGKVDATATAAKTDHDTINNLIIAYENDPTGSFVSPKLPSLDNGTPELEYEIKHSSGRPWRRRRWAVRRRQRRHGDPAADPDQCATTALRCAHRQADHHLYQHVPPPGRSSMAATAAASATRSASSMAMWWSISPGAAASESIT